MSNTVAAAVSTVVGQGLENITGKAKRTREEIFVNTVENSILAFTCSHKTVSLKKWTRGRNSMAAVYKSGMTKLHNGTAKRMSRKVVLKGIKSGVVEGAIPSFLSGIWGRFKLRIGKHKH